MSALSCKKTIMIFLFFGVLPAVLFWVFFLSKNYPPSIRLATVTYGVLYIPFSIRLLKKYKSQTEMRIIRFFVWWPYLIYSASMLYLALMMTLTIVNKHVTYFTDFGAVFSGVLLIFVSIACIFFVARVRNRKQEEILDA